ncbi:MAG: replication-associated recombination protein A [Phycisphaeraceae bacterium]|nr:replication-associated recombination protein A [Phycisphaeraceae bacterium]
MSDLWASKRKEAVRKVEPLAVRMRPRTFDEVAGQRHILAPGKLLRRMLDADALTSLILFGPPGTGKTTLAEVIAAHTNRHFERENAAGVGVARIREIIQNAAERLANSGRRTVLFLDEIHRFSRAQQDVLLGDVERGLITLIGATTENPLFSVNSALVSRSTLLRLEPLSEDDVIALLRRAIADPVRGYGSTPITVTDDALRVWAIKSDGDARRALTALEVAVLSQGKGGDPSHLLIDRAAAEESIQQKAAVYSGSGDEHYDSISAMIKSVRGSDPDAAVYWIARMLDAGEDPRFICRRLAILASEDIGNADPRAIMVAASCWELVERIGMPEARITISQTAIYLALAPKSNASYLAIDEAMQDVKEGRTIPVPVFLKDGNVRKPITMSEGGGEALGAQSGAGQTYVYTHDVAPTAGVGGVSGQDYLGVDREYYRPTTLGAEKLLKERLEAIKAARRGTP